jgi:hypothetical protein
VAASSRTGRKDRTQLHDALLSRGPIAKTGATLRSVRKKLQGRVRGATTNAWSLATFQRRLTNGLLNPAKEFDLKGPTLSS